MAAMKGRVNGVMLGIGGASLLYAGIDKRAPKCMRDLSLEWMYRLWLEPKRLWRRYVVTNSLFLVLFTDEALLAYNRQYLQHNEYTDIITFDTRPDKKERAVHGDILISYDRVKENAATYGVRAQHELHRVMVHGLLHLCGHGDKTEKQRAEMRALGDKYLNLLR